MKKALQSLKKPSFLVRKCLLSHGIYSLKSLKERIRQKSCLKDLHAENENLSARRRALRVKTDAENALPENNPLRAGRLLYFAKSARPAKTGADRRI